MSIGRASGLLHDWLFKFLGLQYEKLKIVPFEINYQYLHNTFYACRETLNETTYWMPSFANTHTSSSVLGCLTCVVVQLLTFQQVVIFIISSPDETGGVPKEWKMNVYDRGEAMGNYRLLTIPIFSIIRSLCTLHSWSGYWQIQCCPLLVKLIISKLWWFYATTLIPCNYYNKQLLITFFCSECAFIIHWWILILKIWNCYLKHWFFYDFMFSI